MKLDADHTVSIPVDLCRRFGFSPDDELEAVATDEGILIRRPAEAMAVETDAERAASFQAWIDRVAGTLKGGPSTDEIMRMTRGDDWNSAEPFESREPPRESPRD